MELELRHLKVVSTIAEAGSVTKAAAELGIAQSALTAQLSRIERALGGAVFDRDHRGARPTPLGELVIERARVLLPAMSGLMDDASRLSGTDPERVRTRRLSLGASTAAILAPLIQRLGRWRDDLAISTTASWSAEELVGQLVEARLDVAVIGLCSGTPDPTEPGLVWARFAVDPVFVLLPEEHPLADRDEVSLADLAEADWAATPGDSCFQECFAAACAREGFAPRSLYVADAASCIDLVASGTAVALCQATRVLPGLRTVPLAGAPLSWNHLVGWWSDALEPELADGLARTVASAQRDLGLSAAEAKDRVADEAAATRAEKTLVGSLGSDYAGSWYDAEAGTLVVAVTDAGAVRTVRAEGAQAEQVDHSADTLEAHAEALDDVEAPSTVASWFVDVESNSVVVSTRDEAAAEAFVAEAGVPADAVTIEKSAEMPQPLAQGGDAYYIGGGRCSIGFAVNGGFITAGHCGRTGATTTSPSGRFAGSSFPGNDYAYVTTSTVIAGTVNNYSGGSVAVRGSADAPIGASICRSGSTTGWRCGTIQARNSTVNYAEGSVTGLIRTSACAEPGDSGGSALSGNQAQGVTSGGSGNCTFGGTTYFQPVNEILNAYGLSLRLS